MKPLSTFRWMLCPFFLSALLCTTPLSASALPWGKESPPVLADFSKNGLVGEAITFSPQDFALSPNHRHTLLSITLCTLPDPGAGTLTIGGQPLTVGTVVDATALAGLHFQALAQPTTTTSTFSFLPTFSDGTTPSQETQVTLYLLDEANAPPIARNMDLSTYQNVDITGYFDAVDQEGDCLTFQLTKAPARGAVQLAEDGSGRFVYSPYENKTGSDRFTYVALDQAGNTSSEATITIQIERPATSITYGDMKGHPAHKASIRLAEEGILTGEILQSTALFHPDRPVTRSEFLSMAMAVVQLPPLEDITVTGFSDDHSIPSWAKGAVSAALKAGIIQGVPHPSGAPAFAGDSIITWGEASVIMNRLLQMTDVPVEVFAPQEKAQHWAGQAVANLSASGMLPHHLAASLSEGLTRGEAAELLDGAFEVMDRRRPSLFPWN